MKDEELKELPPGLQAEVDDFKKRLSQEGSKDVDQKNNINGDELKHLTILDRNEKKIKSLWEKTNRN